MRIALGLEYDGRSFQGWQRLRSGPSIQAHVEAAISKVADHEVSTACAGRTDRGVHATYQVVHFDTDSHRENHAWVFGCNTHLPGAISVLWARVVDERFHARFSATGRTYRYWILNRPARPGLLRGLVTWEHRPLAIERMQSAATALLGEHDFSGYRAQACQSKSPVREVRKLEVRRYDDWVLIEIEANAFLHHMVRNIAGVLMTIGKYKAAVAWAGEILAHGNRTAGGVTAPPDGLYLAAIDYAAAFGLPQPAFAIGSADGLRALHSGSGSW